MTNEAFKVMTGKRITRRSLLLLVLLCGLGSSAFAQGGGRSARRVQFPAGRTTTVLKGVLRGTQDATYVVRARKGQTLIAHLSVANDCCASLMIKGPDNNSLTNPDGTDASDDFSIILQRTGDYRVIVFPPETAGRRDTARYTLELTIR
ncbi:MAG TPA: hypothetical protein VF723_05395 [Pyrinomonadaceae bacterium]|jgi:hypothetical protein